MRSPGNGSGPARKADIQTLRKEQRKRNAERASREKEKDATYLKLQSSEIVAPTLDADGKAIKLALCARKDENLVGKKGHIIYVAKDAGLTEPGRFPTIVYGFNAKAPYNWPGVSPLRESEIDISGKARHCPPACPPAR